jgi:putative DNA primase/helicase
MLSTEFYEGRILGVSKVVRLSTRSLFLFSGNNVDVLADMARRIVTIKLDPQVEVPAAREFDGEPLELARSNRGAYIADVLTLVRAYQRQGVPDETLKRTNGYLHWSGLCREPLVWLGLPDPCAAMFEQLQHDPYREQLEFVLNSWYGEFGTSAHMVRDVIKAAESSKNKDLEEALLTVSPGKSDTIDRKHLGWWLKKNSGKQIDGKRFVRDTSRKRNAQYWRVELVTPPAGMTLSPTAPKQIDLNDLTDSSNAPNEADTNQQSRFNRKSRDGLATGAEVSAQSHAHDDGEVF